MKRKKAIFYLMCVIALAAAAAVIGFLVYTLKLRTDFRADAMEINNMFLKKGIVNVSCGEESFQFPAEDLEYYDKFLLDRNTVIELGRMALDNRLFVLCFILKAVITAQRERYVRKKSKPLLIIIDEAHVVLQNTRDGGNKAANYLIGLINSIIKEGRKYGLYLILSDQSPIMLQGILPNVKCKLIMKEEEE